MVFKSSWWWVYSWVSDRSTKVKQVFVLGFGYACDQDIKGCVESQKSCKEGKASQG